MVDADHAERRTLASWRQGHGDGGLVEGGRDVVNGDGVVGVSAVHWLVILAKHAVDFFK